jgi:anti-sigma factor (TIGR02949 family)
MTPDHAKSTSGAEVDCNAALESLFDFLDGELDGSLEARLRAHVQECRPCFERADFERRFLAAVQAARAEERCPNALRERVLTTLRAEGLGA